MNLNCFWNLSPKYDFLAYMYEKFAFSPVTTDELPPDGEFFREILTQSSGHHMVIV